MNELAEPPSGHRPHRRDALGLAAMGAVAAFGGLSSAVAQNLTPAVQIAAALGEGQRFSATALADLARALAKRPFVPQPNDVPDPFANLPYDRYVQIRSVPAARVWQGEGRGFVLDPLLRGFVFTAPVLLYTVEDGTVRRIGFDRSRYDFGALNVPPNAPDPGYSGFRLEATTPGGPPFEFGLVQGATFFRTVARGQNFGTLSRALALKPAEAKGEEFPFFRAHWIERPSAGSNALVVHALIDSESTTGITRMTFRPGDVTIVDVETTLFPRVTLEHVGLGAMGATYLSGPNVRRLNDDIRRAVADAGGLSILNGQGEWIWRPLNNPDSLQISAFIDRNPKGFGLLQRERDFSAYQDDSQHFEARPSVWIEPLGEWQEGAVQLLEIPSDSEINDNILAYWRPKAPAPAGQDYAVAYRQFWCWTPPEKPAVATVALTRTGRGGGGRRRRFIVEFTGQELAAAVPDLKPMLGTNLGAVQNVRLYTYPDRSSARVVFDLDPGSETAIELRLVLVAGTRIVSETWLYRWTP